jgi:hypothetical protein
VKIFILTWLCPSRLERASATAKCSSYCGGGGGGGSYCACSHPKGKSW